MAAEDPQSVSRRRLLTMGIGGIAGLVSLLLGIPLIGFVASVFGRKPSTDWVRVCGLNEVSTDTPTLFRVAFRRTDAMTPYDDVRGVFVIQRANDLIVFSNVCTHMQCSVRWLDWREQILCPCHAGTYDRWGVLSGGPPAFSLPLYEYRVQNNAIYVTDRQIFRPAPRPGAVGG